MKKNNWLSNSLEDTKAIAHELSALMSPGMIVCFHGDLGAGKTTFIKSLIHSFSGIHENSVHSPTFTYLIEHGSSPVICHFDLYRLQDPEEFESMGFLDYFTSDYICLIEWPERIASYIPEKSVHIHISYADENKREISIK